MVLTQDSVRDNAAITLAVMSGGGPIAARGVSEFQMHCFKIASPCQ